MYSVHGPILGALVLILVPELGRGWEVYRLTAYGILVVGLMIALPGGLISLVTGRRRELDSTNPPTVATSR